MSEIALRPYLPADARALAEIFCASIEILAEDDYSEGQRAAWMTLADNIPAFGKKLAGELTLVALRDGEPVGFAALKGGLVDRIETHTCTVTEFLQAGDEPISRFVLLDHMDWMSSYHPAALIEEWNHILQRAAPEARLLLRSAHANPPFLDWLRVGPDSCRLKDVASFDVTQAAHLQQEDRVHTYAGFVIASLKSNGQPI